MSSPSQPNVPTQDPAGEERYTFHDATDLVERFMADDPEAVAQSAEMLEEMHRTDRQYRSPPSEASEDVGLA